MNEKGFTNHESRITNHEPEPNWIRDSQIVKVEFDDALNARGFDWIAEICAGERQYCEHCGADFPMWPTKAWADHAITEHAAAMTIQARTGMAQMCAEGASESSSIFFAMMFAQRVSLRRRAWQLGYAKAEEQKPWLVS